jgi:hypothetical protein
VRHHDQPRGRGKNQAACEQFGFSPSMQGLGGRGLSMGHPKSFLAFL